MEINNRYLQEAVWLVFSLLIGLVLSYIVLGDLLLNPTNFSYLSWDMAQ